MVNVYENNPENEFGKSIIVARVKYNTRLDYWDGNNMTNGGTGMHKGITKLKKPVNPEKPYVIIIGSQWAGAKDYGYCVSADVAVYEILNAGAEENSWVWPEITEIIEKLSDCEE